MLKYGLLSCRLFIHCQKLLYLVFSQELCSTLSIKKNQHRRRCDLCSYKLIFFGQRGYVIITFAKVKTGSILSIILKKKIGRSEVFCLTNIRHANAQFFQMAKKKSKLNSSTLHQLKRWTIPKDISLFLVVSDVPTPLLAESKQSGLIDIPYQYACSLTSSKQCLGPNMTKLDSRCLTFSITPQLMCMQFSKKKKGDGMHDKHIWIIERFPLR